MSKFKVGIIGCGRPYGVEGATGYGMAYAHAAGYAASPDAEIVAAADINRGNLNAFCAEHKTARGYLSADEMFANERLDIVSICLWPHLHAEMTLKALKAGSVRAIHCEKPMALTYGDAKKMVAACDAAGVQLTFNHMRRFGAPFRRARELLADGAIGELQRLEAYTANLYDWGTHWFDMLFYYNHETPVDWVIGQIDARGGRPIFGAPIEGQGLSRFHFKNGVTGLMVTGYGTQDVANRIIGAEGVIEVGVNQATPLRLCGPQTGGRWYNIEVSGGIHGAGQDLHVLAVLDLIDALKTGREPELSGHRALQATELIFAAWESSRRRGRVDLPLDIEDSPLQAMINHGDVTTWPDGYVEGNGQRFHYWRTGDGSQPPIVLCHGFSDNGLCWTPVARALENDYDVIMLDARGHGLSDAPESGYTTEDHAADLAACIRALGLKQVTVLGHSMGGSTAGLAAVLYPDLIAKALLEDPAWWDEDAQKRFMPTEDREKWLQGRREGILAQKQLSRDALIAQCRQESPAWAEEELGNWAVSKQQLSPNVIQEVAPPGPWQETASRFRCPILLITADVTRGAIVTSALAAKATALNPHIRIAHIAGAGHNVRREAFRAYMEAVTAFLREA